MTRMMLIEYRLDIMGRIITTDAYEVIYIIRLTERGLTSEGPDGNDMAVGHCLKE